ncbi:MAG: hypothetical protein GX267_05265 [Fibrobacter sp.]|jgi:hypothetical protein|nr:hypothetical protein [Fibrobacter sp.]
MKCFTIVFCFFLAGTVFSQSIPDPVLEIGLGMGEPTGLTIKYWMTEKTAVDVGAGWSAKKKLLDVYLDYQYHYFWSEFDAKELPVYTGAGIMASLNSDFMVGLRIPFGTEYLIEGPRLVAFAQVAPTFRIIPKPGLFIAGGLGIRYAF